MVQQGNYCGPTLDIERPERFPNDKNFVEFVESKAVGMYGTYLDKETKITSLDSWRRINRVFDLLGVEYDDRPILAKQRDEAAEGAKEKKPIPTKDKWPAKPSDVRLGRESAKPSKKSLKFTLGSSDRDSGAAYTEGVRGGFDASSSFVLKIFVACTNKFFDQSLWHLHFPLPFFLFAFGFFRVLRHPDKWRRKGLLL